MTTLIEKTLEPARKLVNLLENPQPGLSTWNGAVVDRIKELAELMPTSVLQDTLIKRALAPEKEVT